MKRRRDANSQSFGDLLRRLRFLFPETLLGTDGFERVVHVAARLPLCAIDQPFGFEFVLSDEFTNADFCVVPAPGTPFADYYINEGKKAPPNSPAAALGAILDRSKYDANSFLRRNNGGIILEYDVPTIATHEYHAPGVFIVQRDTSIDVASRLFDDSIELYNVLCSLTHWRHDVAELHEIQRVIKLFDGIAVVGQAGVLPGRPYRAIRLVVHHIDVTELPDILDHLHWTGSIDTVMSTIVATQGFTQPGVVLSLDVSADGISSRLGIELFRPAGSAQIDGRGWHPLIERLEQLLWCVSSKADGLRTCTFADRLVGHGSFLQVYQYINHIKLVVERDLVTAKAYVAMVIRSIND